jgi:hypothetical protein
MRDRYALLLLLAFVAPGLACASDQNGPQVCALCDSLDQFKSVDITFDGQGIYFACADSLFDERCKNEWTTSGDLTFPVASLSAEAIVKRSEADHSVISIVAQDNRLLALSDRGPVSIIGPTVQNIPFGNIVAALMTSAPPTPDALGLGGARVEYHVDGDANWLLLGPTGTYWSDVTIDALGGTAKGNINQCTGSTCTPDVLTIQFPPLPSGKLIEYRMTLVPIWKMGQLSTGTYEVGFGLK